MKTQAVVRRVVETVLFEMYVIAEVCEAGVSADLLAQVVHPVEDVRQHRALLDVRLGAQPESALAHGAVGRLEEWEELRRGLLLAVPLDGHRAVDLGPLRLELRKLGE